MVFLMWLHTVTRRCAVLRSNPVGHPVSALDAGRQILIRRLDADDPYWWILTGGICVPGFGPHVARQPASGKPPTGPRSTGP
jgi:hypothetical protein